jgi:N6-L-threonylcarbamoyladenine synthase
MIGNLSLARRMTSHHAHDHFILHPPEWGMRLLLRLAGASIRLRTTRRSLMTLAIETSCDDTSVAIVEKDARDADTVAQLRFHKKITSDNSAHRGVHPLVSLQSHQQNLARLVAEAIAHLPRASSHPPRDGSQTANIETLRLPDFISVTRGPGMRSNLFTGLDTAKGLAVAWQVVDAPASSDSAKCA